MTEIKCPKCSADTYADGNVRVCVECFHEFNPKAAVEQPAAEETTDHAVRDAHGNILHDGDSVVVLKDLKIKGSSSSVKAGTKVRNIRLHDGYDGHNIACKIDGFGAIDLKSEFVKKA